MKNILIKILLVVFVLPLTAQSTYYETPDNEALKALNVKESFTFLVMGDWGRNGEFYQKPVAEQMASASKTMDAELVISVEIIFIRVGCVVCKTHNGNNLLKMYIINIT